MVGQNIPEVVFKTRVRDESVGGENPYRWHDALSTELFSGNVVMLAVPGAFTPTCSSTHLPGYESAYDDIKGCGIDEVFCLSVNDAFTMFQWAKHLGIEKVRMVPDGSGDFTRLMGMLVRKDDLGYGYRSWRYAMHVRDGAIVKLFSEPGKCDNCPEDPFTVSDAQTMLRYLQDCNTAAHEAQ